MLLTSTMLFWFVGLSLLALGIGIFAENQLVYFLGVILLLFLGLMTFSVGVVTAAGQEQNASIVGNVTSTVVTDVYEPLDPTWNNSLSLLFIVMAAGLSLQFYRVRKEKAASERDSIEVE